MPVFGFALLLFMSGVAMAVLVFIPITMKLLEGIKTDMLAPLITASEYYGFVITTSLAFGAVFELPILVLLLTALGLITPKFMVKYRRHAFVLLLFICEVVTPGDLIISTLALFIPVYGLYELSIIVSWFVYRRRQRRLARQAEESAS